MSNFAEERVSKFYNTVGWKENETVTEDARRWEDLRACAKEYVAKCRLRIARHIPAGGENILDMASGPIQYPEYLGFSKNFNKRYCVDLSATALEEAKRKIGDHGVFLCGSFFEIPLEENFFDCSMSLHTIYHMDESKQEEAVRKLLKVTKPGKPVIIVYSNPKKLLYYFGLPVRLLLGSLKRKAQSDLYFQAHPNSWWSRFNNVASVKILPWRSFTANHQKALIPDNTIGKKIFSCLYYLEEKFPNFFARFFQYPMIVLVKESG